MSYQQKCPSVFLIISYFLCHVFFSKHKKTVFFRCVPYKNKAKTKKSEGYFCQPRCEYKETQDAA